MLQLKKQSGVRTAARHYIHALNSRLQAADEDIARVKPRAVEAEGVSEKSLDERYPDNMFKSLSQDLTRVDELIEDSIESSESLRQVALQLQQSVTKALSRIESRIAVHQGYSKIVDEKIDNILVELFLLSAAATFIEKSMDTRTERMQVLLDKPSFSAFCNALGLHLTQKDMAATAADDAYAGIKELFDESAQEREASLKEAKDEGESPDVVKLFVDDFKNDIERITDRSIEKAVDADFYAPAVELIDDTFETSDETSSLKAHTVPDIASTIADKLFKKVRDGALEQLNDELVTA